MGTRADFYVGRGEGAEWLGSIAWDGYPNGIEVGVGPSILTLADEAEYRAAVNLYLKAREDGTLPDMGWPWPWETSHTTDFAYALDDGKVWGSCFGGSWRDPLNADEDWDDEGHEDEPAPVFPDMKDRQNVQFGGKRSGIMVISAPSSRNEAS